MFKDYILVFFIAFCLSFLLTPLVKLASRKMGWLDYPNWRKMNKDPVPLMGGLAIYIGFVISLLSVMFKNPFRDNLYKFWGLLAGSFIIVLIGFVDDVNGLSARRKLFYQITASAIAVLMGYAIFKVTNPLGESFSVSSFISFGISLFWIVGFINAINLIDGLDGLAAGVSAIISASLFFAAVRSNSPIVAILAIALAGSILGFLPFNFYPAKIFMGDTGSMFLGFVLALISMEGTYKGATFITMMIPIVAMGVPVVDTGLSIIRRLIKGNGIFKADKEHIHHKLLVREGSPREAVVILYFLTACFGMIAIALSRLQGIAALFALIITAILTLRWIVNSGFMDFLEEKKGADHQKARHS